MLDIQVSDKERTDNLLQGYKLPIHYNNKLVPCILVNLKQFTKIAKIKWH